MKLNLRHSCTSLMICLLFSLTTMTSVAAEKSQRKDTKVSEKIRRAPELVLNNMGSIADSAQRLTTDRFNRFVLSIDDFFGDAESTAETNRSWGRLRVDALKPSDESWDAKARLKVRIVLPQAQRRLRLLLSTEDADVNGSQGRGNLDASDDGQDVALALRFVRSLSDRLKLNFDLGARMRDRKGQVFGRISASNASSLGWGWEQQISNNFFLYSSSGYQNRFRWDIRKPLNDASSVFFRSSTSVEGQKGISGARINETLGLYFEIDASSAVALEGLYGFVTSKDQELDKHYLGSEYRIRYRKNVWRPWFYYEVWPSVSFPASTDYKREYGGLLRVEVLFGQY